MPALRPIVIPINRPPFCHSPFDKSLNLRHCMDVKPKRIRLFIKPYCGWCHKAVHWLNDQKIKYEKVDVIADETAFDEMIRLSGQDLAPVLDVVNGAGGACLA